MLVTAGVLMAASVDKGVLGQRTEHWPEAAACLERVGPDDAIVFSNGITRDMLGWYSPGALRGFANPEPHVFARNERQGVAREAIGNHVRGRARVWLLNAYTELGPEVQRTIEVHDFVAQAPMTCGPVQFVRLDVAVRHQGR
jgi:hypothetical protein